ncbi:MAG: hypothetical protein HeimC2_38850 [Candidatus Heimdallarchaeota archaeon LC_2]|nr:MAG: hypothetical protein HeimC2_38850 [Candidatus Heimdallarchaeota archaeon LC_2]
MGDEIADFDNIWDYSNPKETEIQFRDILSRKKLEDNKSYYLQLQTQIARTLSLQQKFDEAHQVLDEVETQLTEDYSLEWVRYLLERGRSFNSDNQKEQTVHLFKQAYEISSNLGLDFFTVDAAHMLGITDQPEFLIEWNEKAIQIAENSSSERARNWQGSLLNNLGWTHHDKQEHEVALGLFEKALQFREKQGKLETILIAKWSVARTYRSLNRIDEAIKLQLEIKSERSINDLALGGYNYEELGELFLLKNDKNQAKDYFKVAFEELSKDIWLTKNESQRLERIELLSSS